MIYDIVFQPDRRFERPLVLELDDAPCAISALKQARAPREPFYDAVLTVRPSTRNPVAMRGAP